LKAFRRAGAIAQARLLLLLAGFSEHKTMKLGRLLWVFLILFLLGLGARAGSFLIVDAPKHSDVILVLAGETSRRPERALQLLAQGYGSQIVLDVPTNATIYEFTQIQLAQQYVRDLPQGAAVSICPIEGLSTRDETRDVAKCLGRAATKSVLIVTSDFHTRRALSIFRHEIPQYTYSSAAARDDEQFGARWWRHRQWAKTFVDEWMRLIWWEAVDRWR
jgi:uncharacterized SAM-binding protein YcdF (DUF218 family)